MKDIPRRGRDKHDMAARLFLGVIIGREQSTNSFNVEADLANDATLVWNILTKNTVTLNADAFKYDFDFNKVLNVLIKRMPDAIANIKMKIAETQRTAQKGAKPKINEPTESPAAEEQTSEQLITRYLMEMATAAKSKVNELGDTAMTAMRDINLNTKEEVLAFMKKNLKNSPTGGPVDITEATAHFFTTGWSYATSDPTPGGYLNDFYKGLKYGQSTRIHDDGAQRCGDDLVCSIVTDQQMNVAAAAGVGVHAAEVYDTATGNDTTPAAKQIHQTALKFQELSRAMTGSALTPNLLRFMATVGGFINPVIDILPPAVQTVAGAIAKGAEFMDPVVLSQFVMFNSLPGEDMALILERDTTMNQQLTKLSHAFNSVKATVTGNTPEPEPEPKPMGYSTMAAASVGFVVSRLLGTATAIRQTAFRAFFLFADAAAQKRQGNRYARYYEICRKHQFMATLVASIGMAYKQ